jgi:DNA-binding winged helix-turn-helix (wHTH) protein
MDFVFEPFRLDESERRLTQGTQVVHLEPKAFDVSKGIWDIHHSESGNRNRIIESRTSNRARIEAIFKDEATRT